MTSRRSRWLIMPSAVAALALVAAACGSGSNTSAPAPNTASSAGTSSGAMLTTVKSSLGTILVDGRGRTLYLFEKDGGTKSSCQGACAQAWPPFMANGTPHAGSGASASLIGTTSRTDGRTEVTYNGHPLYYYMGDSGPDQTHGQGLDQFGGGWYVLSNNGDKIEKGGS